MSTKMEQPFMIFWLFFSFNLFADVVPNIHPVERAQQKLMMRAMKKQLVHDVKVNVNLVSEKDEQLSGVLLELVVLDEKGSTTEKKVVDKTFVLNYKNVIRVDVAITKPGYYDEKKVFAANLMKEDTVVVELVEIGQHVALQEFQGFISFCPTGMSMVASFVPNEKMISSLLSKDILAESGAFPQHGIYVQTDVDNSKAFVLQPWRGMRVPSGVRLRSFNEEDGFIPYECFEQNPGRADRRMRTAPESGYKSSMLVPPSENKFYFYCKIGGLYGKGFVDPVRSIQTGDKIETFFRILLQSEKSNDRNVAGSR